MGKGEVDLEPCPFDGGAAFAFKVFERDRWVAKCNTCDATCEGNSEEAVTAAWNRRTPATAQSPRPGEEALREKVKELIRKTSCIWMDTSDRRSADQLLGEGADAILALASPLPVGGGEALDASHLQRLIFETLRAHSVVPWVPLDGLPEFVAFAIAECANQIAALSSLPVEGGGNRDLGSVGSKDDPSQAADSTREPAGPVNCTHVLRRDGKAYPRTCARCGLGPCPFYNQDGSAKR